MNKQLEQMKRDLEDAKGVIEAMCKEFRDHDLPYGSTAYLDAQNWLGQQNPVMKELLETVEASSSFPLEEIVSEEDIAETIGGTRYVMAEWIEWNSGNNPLALDVMHQRRYRDGIEGNVTNGRMGGDYHWKHEGGNADIMAYRVAKGKL